MLLSVEHLPQTDEPKKKTKVNCLQDMMLDLMVERKITLAQIHKETRIPQSTLSEWRSGAVETQKVDWKLFALARYFDVTLDYLCFGVGTGDPYYSKFESESIH